MTNTPSPYRTQTLVQIKCLWEHNNVPHASTLNFTMMPAVAAAMSAMICPFNHKHRRYTLHGAN